MFKPLFYALVLAGALFSDRALAGAEEQTFAIPEVEVGQRHQASLHCAAGPREHPIWVSCEAAIDGQAARGHWEFYMLPEDTDPQIQEDLDNAMVVDQEFLVIVRLYQVPQSAVLCYRWSADEARRRECTPAEIQAHPRIEQP